MGNCKKEPFFVRERSPLELSAFAVTKLRGGSRVPLAMTLDELLQRGTLGEWDTLIATAPTLSMSGTTLAVCGIQSDR